MSSTAGSQLQNQHEYKQHQYDSTGQNKQEKTNETTKTKKNESV
jgi:hypothetical protein